MSKKYSAKFVAMQQPRAYRFGDITKMSEKELRKEYSKLRSIMRKRIERAKSHEDTKRSRDVAMYEKQFRPLSDIDKYNINITAVLADLRHAVNEGVASVQTIRAKNLATEELTKAMPATSKMPVNVRGEFFEYLYSMGLVHAYDSGEVAAAADNWELYNDGLPDGKAIENAMDEYLEVVSKRDIYHRDALKHRPGSAWRSRYGDNN